MSDDGKNGLRVAILTALTDAITQEDTRVRSEGAETWRDLKDQGFPHQMIKLPGGGPPVGMLLFRGGTPGVDVDDGKVLAYVKAHESAACLEDTVDPSALTDPDVIDLLKKHKPGLVRQRVRPGIAERLTKEAKGNHGRIMHPDGSGACTTVGTTYTSKVEGKVTWRPEKDALGRIMAALRNGTIGGDLGLWPLQIAAAPTATAPAPAVTVIPGSAEPPPLKLHGETYVQATLDEAQQDGKPGAAAA